jgi:hypothetical protein
MPAVKEAEAHKEEGNKAFQVPPIPTPLSPCLPIRTHRERGGAESGHGHCQSQMQIWAAGR